MSAMPTLERTANLPALEMVRPSRAASRIAWTLGVIFLLHPVVLLLVPWQQNVPASGQVVAWSPLERQQTIDAPVYGRLVDVVVVEGSRVAKGQRLMTISDIDPNYLSNLEAQRSFLESQLDRKRGKAEEYTRQIENLEVLRDSSVRIAEQAVTEAEQDVRDYEEKLNQAKHKRIAAEFSYQMNDKLLNDPNLPGMISREAFVKSKAEFDVATAAVEQAEAQLNAATAKLHQAKEKVWNIRADADVKIRSSSAMAEEARAEIADTESKLRDLTIKISRQQSQVVTAPIDGTVFRVHVAISGQIVKQGDRLVTIVPDTQQRAVELWVDGNDTPLISEGRHVRLQFEGWPAVQFAGWPSVAVGTFGGTVALVDPTDNGMGKFRILVVPDEAALEWPEDRWLRQGVRTKAWVLLNQVPLGWELWRQLNGFPPTVSMEAPKDDVARKRLK